MWPLKILNNDNIQFKFKMLWVMEYEKNLNSLILYVISKTLI